MRRNTIGVKTRVVERKAHPRREEWLFQKIHNNPGANRNDLSSLTARKNLYNDHHNNYSLMIIHNFSRNHLKGSSNDESDTNFPPPSLPFGSEREEEDESSLISFEMSDEGSNREKYDAHEWNEDVLEHEEMDDDDDVDNPFFTNASALEKLDKYKKI